MVSASQSQPTRTRTKSRTRQPIHRLVNHFLETPARDEGRSGRPPPTLGAIGAGDERVRDAVCGGASEKGRVLLLDDDPAFREVITDCLVENGYAVVAVQNGGEGVRELLAGDFTMVLCDFMMPGLPGDMFYLAVERIRPALCQRFVFMTGHQNDARTTEFIKGFDGLVLRKPFSLKNLLDSIALAEVRHTFHSVFDGVPADPDGSRVCQLADNFPTGGTHSAQASSVAKILARGPTEMGLERRSDGIAASEPELRAGAGSRSIVFAGLALLLLLGAGLWNRYSDARDRVKTTLEERRAREVERAEISGDLQKAVVVRSKIELVQSQLARISAERTKPRWTAAFRGILPAPDAGIELLEVWARGVKVDFDSCEVRVSGVASGVQPRLQADRFRQAVEENLKGIANGRPVKTRFEHLEDAPAAQPAPERVTFVVIATVGLMEPLAGTGKEAR